MVLEELWGLQSLPAGCPNTTLMCLVSENSHLSFPGAYIPGLVESIFLGSVENIRTQDWNSSHRIVLIFLVRMDNRNLV